MRDEPRTGRRAGQQCPDALAVSSYEVVGPVRSGVDVGLHLGQQRIHRGLGHETLDDRHTRRGERRSNIGRRRISREARNVGRTGGGASGIGGTASGNVSHGETVVAARKLTPAAKRHAPGAPHCGLGYFLRDGWDAAKPELASQYVCWKLRFQRSPSKRTLKVDTDQQLRRSNKSGMRLLATASA